jgi:hypothetical protein
LKTSLSIGDQIALQVAGMIELVELPDTRKTNLK